MCYTTNDPSSLTLKLEAITAILSCITALFMGASAIVILFWW